MLIPEGMVEAFGLILLRTSALVVSAPIIGFGGGFSGHKVALIFFLSLLVFWTTGSTLGGEVDPAGYAIFALREVLIGLFLSFFLHLTLLAVRVTGELIGHEMGFMIANQADPLTGIQTPLVTSLYENLFVLGLLSMNGHQWLVRALADSFERAPVGELSFATGTAPAIERMFSQMMQAGIVFAAPVMVFLVLTSILIGLLARAVPHLNVLEIGFTLRVLTALIAMFLFAPLFEPAMDHLYASLAAGLDRALVVLES